MKFNDLMLGLISMLSLCIVIFLTIQAFAGGDWIRGIVGIPICIAGYLVARDVFDNL